MRLIQVLFLTAALSLVGPADQERGEREFKDPTGKYQLVLRDLWEPNSYEDGAGNMVTDIIYGNSEDGILRIRQFRVDPGTTAQAYASREEEVSLRFRLGFVRGAHEPFSGTYHSGVVFNFEFTRRGRRTAARYYYLKIDESTLYVLQFEGRPEILRSIRNRTDLIARSFKVIQ